MSYTTEGHLQNLATVKLNPVALTALLQAYAFDLSLYVDYWAREDTLELVFLTLTDKDAWGDNSALKVVNFDAWSHEELALFCLVTRDVYIAEGKIEGDMNEAQNRLDLFKDLVPNVT